jgi:Transglycosylase SLT domain
MTRPAAARGRMRKIPRKSKSEHRFRIEALWPSARLRKQWLRALRRSSAFVQVLIGLAAVVTLCFALNWVYQVIRKPSELFFPVSGTLNKTPPQTWRQYAPIFEANATRVMTPEFLAALAQVEGSGNPVARTYWRWSWKPWPFDLYRPASSAVGMYQITDGTFADARRFCIHHHTVVEDGPWNAWHSCWFNRLYTRVVPAHAVELTSAYLDHNVASILERHGTSFPAVRQMQELAALIHLCGAAAGDAYVRRGLKLLDGQHCGDQEVRGYLARVDAMKRVFALLAAERARM